MKLFKNELTPPLVAISAMLAAGAAFGGVELPDGYAIKKCVTIPNTGTSSHNGIVSGIPWKNVAKVYVKYATTDAGGSFMLFGSVNSATDCSGCGGTYAALQNGTASAGDTGSKIAGVTGAFVPADRSSYKRDGVARWLTLNVDANSDAKLLFFGCGWNDTSWSKTADWYAVKIYGSDGRKLADFVPCVRTSDDEVGFYDTVSEGFFARGLDTWAPFTATDYAPGETVETESAKPDARAYIQDGLILQLDGVENAGYGLHDATAATWTDLVGGHVLTPEGTPAWGADHMVFDGVDSKALVGSSPEAHAAFEAKNATVEICVLPTANVGNTGPYGFGTGQYVMLWANGLQYGYWPYAKGVYGTFNKVPTGWQTSTLVFETKNPSYWSDGVKVGAFSYGTSVGDDVLSIGRWTSGTAYAKMKAYSFRVYNRALTADEIAYNARVDEQRFMDIPFSDCAVQVSGSPCAFGTSMPAYGASFVPNTVQTLSLDYAIVKFDDGVEAIDAADGVRGQFGGVVVQSGSSAPVTNDSASVAVDLTCGRLSAMWLLKDVQYRVRIDGSSEALVSVNGSAPASSYEGWHEPGERLSLKVTSTKGNNVISWGEGLPGGAEMSLVVGSAVTLTPTFTNYIVNPGEESYPSYASEPSAAQSVESRVKTVSESEETTAGSRGLGLLLQVK